MFNFLDGRVHILDGAMGTTLQKNNLPNTKYPDIYSITHPDVIIAIHRAYIESGAELIYSNTFTANAKKLAGSGYTAAQVVAAGVACAKKACEGTKAKVALDISSLGEMMEPAGTLKFEQAYEAFKDIVVAGRDAGADCVVVETIFDLYEAKAAALAVKENCDLPLMMSMTFEADGNTFTGTSIEIAAAVLEGLGVDVIGINCSLGPAQILPLAKRLCAATTLPVFIKPNAGLPNPVTGAFDLTAESFCEQMLAYKELPVVAIGGCCGSAPHFIKLLAAAFKNTAVRGKAHKAEQNIGLLCSATRANSRGGVNIIGERLNPTGKPLLKQALKTGDYGYIMQQAVLQKSEGAQILDVNVGLPDIDEAAVMPQVIKAVQSVCDLPLCIDSTKPQVIEAALRVYNGRALVNSVNGERASLDAILPLCKKYGAAVVGLTLNEQGIPATAQGRFEIAKTIVNECAKYGIRREDIYIDCLTLAVGAAQSSATVALDALKLVKTLGVKTLLGVSNISFGLPQRDDINAAFLTLALGAGLDMPIMNPASAAMQGALYAFNVLCGADEGAKLYIEKHAAAPKRQQDDNKALSLHEAILSGLKAAAAQAATTLLATSEPSQIIDEQLIPALDIVGEKYECGEYYLPQLLASSQAALSAFDIIRAHLAKSGATLNKGTVVLATVKGDIHDIGKNIVKTMLSNYSYNVIDLGCDVAPESVLQAVVDSGAKLCGLSTLMTTTLPAMEATTAILKAHGCEVMVGGAVVTGEYAAKIGALYPGAHAKCSVDAAKLVYNN